MQRQESTPDDFGPHYERQVAARDASAGEAKRGRRHSLGIFYTPPAAVDYIVEQTLGPLVEGRSPRDVMRLRIVDPACGCGAFLLGAYRWLCRHIEQALRREITPNQRRNLARRLHGIDLDPLAVGLSREALSKAAGIAPQSLIDNIRHGDALLDHDDWFRGQFDAVLMNPPYVNIRRLTRDRGAAVAEAYRKRYRCARGAFDLYPLFIERAAAALRSDGRLGAIVPNKLATLDYASPCRELLLRSGTIDLLADVSRLRLFRGAGVYPYIIVWTRRQPAKEHVIRIVRPVSAAGWTTGRGPDVRVLQSVQSASRGFQLASELDVECRTPTRPLGELCQIHSGATGFQAEALAARLIECGSGPQGGDIAACDFIVSGNIDPYAIRLGNVRFMGRRFTRPVLAKNDPLLTPRKRDLYGGPKIVLSGMGRRLEAALDATGLALGVQVYALTEWQVDPLYLLGLLNSRLLTHLFRLRFAAKQLAGGYFSLAKRQLAQLPIRLLDLRLKRERRIHDHLVALVKQRLRAEGRAADELDHQIDKEVLSLYRVSASELSPSRAAA